MRNVYGSRGNDRILSTVWKETLSGLDGDDTLRAGNALADMAIDVEISGSATGLSRWDFIL